MPRPESTASSESPKYPRKELPQIKDRHQGWDRAKQVLEQVILHEGSPQIIDDFLAELSPLVKQDLLRSVELYGLSPLRYISTELTRRKGRQRVLSEDTSTQIAFPSSEDALERRFNIHTRTLYSDSELHKTKRWFKLGPREHAELVAWYYNPSKPSDLALALAFGVSKDHIASYFEYERTRGLLNNDAKYQRKPPELEQLVRPTEEEWKREPWQRKIKRSKDGEWEYDYKAFVYLPTNEPEVLQPGRILAYVEETPERAERLLRGDFSRPQLRLNDMGWLAELAMNRYQPLGLRGVISRLQPVTSSLLSYGGRKTQENEHSVLLGIELDASTLFVADMSKNDFAKYPPTWASWREIVDIVGYQDNDMSIDQYMDLISSFTEEEIEDFLWRGVSDASVYWRTAVPYHVYQTRPQEYRVPEIYFTKDTVIHEVHYLEERKVEGNYRSPWW